MLDTGYLMLDVKELSFVVINSHLWSLKNNQSSIINGIVVLDGKTVISQWTAVYGQVC